MQRHLSDRTLAPLAPLPIWHSTPRRLRHPLPIGANSGHPSSDSYGHRKPQRVREGQERRIEPDHPVLRCLGCVDKRYSKKHRSIPRTNASSVYRHHNPYSPVIATRRPIALASLCALCYVLCALKLATTHPRFSCRLSAVSLRQPPSPFPFLSNRLASSRASSPSPPLHAQHDWDNQPSHHPVYSHRNVNTRVGTQPNVHYTRQTTVPLSSSLFLLFSTPRYAYIRRTIRVSGSSNPPHPLLALHSHVSRLCTPRPTRARNGP
jgi:hypothetical protein